MLRALSADGEWCVQYGVSAKFVRRFAAVVSCAIMAWGLAATGGLAQARVQTHAEDSVILPFQCLIERGQIILVPALDKAHRIVGPRNSHAFTACRPGQPDQCRTWQVHRFDMACGTTIVPWLAVVGAHLERQMSRGRISQGKLVLNLGPQWRQTGSVLRPTLAFPPGFAPAIGFLARFQMPVAAPTVVEARQAMPEIRPPRAVAAETLAPHLNTRDVSNASWQTTVELSDVPPRGMGLWRALGAIAVVAAIWGLLLTMRKRVPAVPANASAPADSLDDTLAASCAELIARAVNLHRTARDALASIPTESLRAVLSEDLRRVQAALLTPSLTDDIAAGRWTAAKPVVGAALDDVERIGRIIEGVLASQPAPPVITPQSAPATVSEAFEVLGVNPAASRTVVKKIVDGLRQSWHPDHARNEADRAQREARMKQINVAWDLIRDDLTGRPEQTAA